MADQGRRWALVLGAGDGTRLSGLTTRGGVSVPKQFCLFNGGPSLLQAAVRRATRVVSPERILAVVASRHRPWWERDLAALPASNIVVQPNNRGTAAGVLLPLAVLRARDPQARVAILPSDHYVEDERVIATELHRAFQLVDREPDAIALLGIEPDAPDSGYGWIVPGERAAGGVRSVRAFVEKPDEDPARELLARGGVWNSFLVVAGVETLWRLYERRLPALLGRFRSVSGVSGALDPSRLEELYADLPSHDFSRELLQGSEASLRLVNVPRCGWNDLGTPARLAACIDQLPPHRRVRPSTGNTPARVDLVLSLAGM